MPPPDLLLSIPLSLSEPLKLRTNKLLSKIVKANHNTQYARSASELSKFRQATASLLDGMDDDALSESFHKTVHFTDYDSYAPFIVRFLEKPRKASAITDLLAPGLPDFIVRSSSTSGGLPKHFPCYNILSNIRSSDPRTLKSSDPLRRRTKACMFNLWCHPIDIEDEDNCRVPEIYLSGGSALSGRMRLYLDPKEDAGKMGAIVLDHVAPYATGFINKWHTFLIIHALFAIGCRPLQTMAMAFINTFVDMMRHLDMEFDMVVDCIANGTIPDLDGVAEVRHYLEPNISPDPERAAELRRLGRPSSRPGWCRQVWPNLHEVHATSGGSFASSVPLARWFLGPGVDIVSRGYGSSESWIGSIHGSLEVNQFKFDSINIIELLDVSKSDSISSVVRLWEVERGKRYEIVLTTRNGLWRYRLGDVVEICGFDPTDGVPVFRFIERRNMAIRFPDFMVTENELRGTMSVVPNKIVKVVDWTSTIDDRSPPATIGFFVELAGDPDIDFPVADLTCVPERMLEELSRLNPKVPLSLDCDAFRKPTVWLVRPGTFSEFLQLKLDEGSNNVGQVKVPVVLPKAEYVAWFLNRIVQEL